MATISVSPDGQGGLNFQGHIDAPELAGIVQAGDPKTDALKALQAAVDVLSGAAVVPDPAVPVVP